MGNTKRVVEKISMKDLDTGLQHPFEQYKKGGLYTCTCGCQTTLTEREVCDILIHGKYLYQ